MFEYFINTFVRLQLKPAVFFCCLYGILINFILVLSGCTGSAQYIAKLYPEPEVSLALDEKVSYWQKKHEVKPDDQYIYVRFLEARNEAVDYFLRKGRILFEDNEYLLALEEFKSAQKIHPNSYEVNQVIAKLDGKIKARALLKDVVSLGNKRSSREKRKQLLREILKLDSSDEKASVMLKKLQDAGLKKRNNKKYFIDLNFKKMEFKQALYFVAKSFDINVVFDQSVKDNSLVSIEVDDISFFDAIELLMGTTKHSYKVISKDTLLVFSDTKDRHKKFDDLQLRTFYLKAIAAKDMASLVKGVLGINKVTVNEANNSLIIYDNVDIIKRVEQIISQHDLLPGEVILEVEILEVNLSDADRLGLDFGAYQISSNTSSIPAVGSISDAIRDNTTLNIPSVNFNFFKQQVGAKLLANPSIRVLDGEKAKIHIGDRVPLRKSTIQDATGQTRTTFEYQEIGIRFNVEADLNASEYVTVYVSLEVSALGENLGTSTEQAFRIGTRNADSTMLVRDGETAIMGGLIREEGRTTHSNLKGLGFLGALSGSKDYSSGRTDLLLTITPRVIRSASGKQVNSSHSFESFSYQELSKLDLRPRKQIDDVVGEADNDERHLVVTPLFDINENSNVNEDDVKQVAKRVIKENKSVLELSFLNKEYSVTAGQLFNVSIDAGLWNKFASNHFSLIFNTNVLEYVSANWKNNDAPLNVKNLAESNEIKFNINMSEVKNINSTNVLDIQFRASRTGSSFLVLKPEKTIGKQGEAFNLTSSTAQVFVK